MKDAIRIFGKGILVILGVVFLLAVFCEASRADWSVAGGADLRGGYAEVRYDDEMWGAWLGANNASPRIGAELHTTWGPFLFGAGAVLAKPDAVVGSALRYELRAEWQATEHLSLGWIHESNCRSICENGPLSILPHAKGKTPNEGYNFIILRFRW